MDVDFWAARVHSAKHLHAVQTATPPNHSGNYYNMVMDDQGDHDQVRAWFPCPFCYVEIEIQLLCVHLQKEHCFDLKNAVCPICAANLGGDAIGHFTVRHAHSIRRRNKSQKTGLWSSAPTNMVKDFVGTNSMSPDPLLSPFLCNVPLSVPKDVQKDMSPDFAPTSDVESSASSVRNQVDVEDYEERRQRAVFLQELFMSTVFLDSK